MKNFMLVYIMNKGIELPAPTFLRLIRLNIMKVKSESAEKITQRLNRYRKAGSNATHLTILGYLTSAFSPFLESLINLSLQQRNKIEY